MSTDFEDAWEEFMLLGYPSARMSTAEAFRYSFKAGWYAAQRNEED